MWSVALKSRPIKLSSLIQVWYPYKYVCRDRAVEVGGTEICYCLPQITSCCRQIHLRAIKRKKGQRKEVKRTWSFCSDFCWDKSRKRSFSVELLWNKRGESSSERSVMESNWSNWQRRTTFEEEKNNVQNLCFWSTTKNHNGQAGQWTGEEKSPQVVVAEGWLWIWHLQNGNSNYVLFLVLERGETIQKGWHKI